MDYAKLSHLNGVYLRQADPSAVALDVLERLAKRPSLSFGTDGAARVRDLVPDVLPRARTIEEVAEMCAFAIATLPLPMEEKARATLTVEAKERLRDLAAFLSDAPWQREDLEHWLRDYAEVKGVKLKDVAQPLRVALTGSLTSPPINAVLAALGRGEAMERILAAAAWE
jgi:glutamyl-tRNA synthetase